MFHDRHHRSDIFNGIMASTIFPSLADVFTEAILTEDIFQPHDLVWSRGMTNPMEYAKGLDERDFLNQQVLGGEKMEVGNCIEGSNIQELTQPDDLMIPLMWPNVFDGQEGDTLYVEYEIEVPPEETEVNYPNSPGSAGDLSDFSETSSGPEIESCSSSSDGMISFDKVKVKTEPGVITEPYLPVQAILSPYDEEEDDENYEDALNNRLHSEKQKKRRKSDLEYLADGRKRPGRKKGQTSSVYHLWEFIRDLLHDPKQRIIKWENEQEGIFRVVKSSEVAKQWGNMKKNREKMTYEKLSRSLRYSRKEGYFEDVPKDGGYPKKLCFKFGPKSHGWKKV